MYGIGGILDSLLEVVVQLLNLVAFCIWVVISYSLFYHFFGSFPTSSSIKIREVTGWIGNIVVQHVEGDVRHGFQQIVGGDILDVPERYSRFDFQCVWFLI